MKIKAIVADLIGQENLGRLDYLLKPRLRRSWGGPFNGQNFRRRIYSDLIKKINFEGIVETGTYLGTTTEFFAASGLPVYSVEANPRFYAYSSLRFSRRRERIHLYQGDSVEFLRSLAADEEFPKSNLFFYLDAHGQEHLPLREELEIIFTHWREAVVMIDDFQVPGTDYGYDDYGAGKALNMSYLEPIQYLQIHAFFPAVDAKQETGKKRGCVVLCREANVADELRRIDTLRSEPASLPA
jgi:hypothetical protein